MTAQPDQKSRTKVQIPIKPFWYSDAWIFPKLVTIVTTLDAEGRINAAPYSHIMQYDVMHKRPRIMLGFRQDSHTFKNIAATGEFVINCPTSEFLEDLMETARFYPEGTNELDHTRFTMIESRTIKPPSLAECPQIMECTVDELVRLEGSSGIVFANITAIVMDEGLAEMDRSERIQAMDLPIGLGDQDRADYYFAKTTDVVAFTLRETPRGHLAEKITTSLDWQPDAMSGLMEIPPNVREMVTQQVEGYARGKGSDVVTLEHMNELMAEFGMDSAVMDRFRTRDDRAAEAAAPAEADAAADAPAPAAGGAVDPKVEGIIRTAQSLDASVTFTPEAAAMLTGVPRPFLKKALKGIIKRANEAGVTTVDAAFVEAANAARGG